MQKSALKRGMGRMMVINIREKGEGGGVRFMKCLSRGRKWWGRGE